MLSVGYQHRGRLTLGAHWDFPRFPTPPLLPALCEAIDIPHSPELPFPVSLPPLHQHPPAAATLSPGPGPVRAGQGSSSPGAAPGGRWLLGSRKLPPLGSRSPSRATAVGAAQPASATPGRPYYLFLFLFFLPFFSPPLFTPDSSPLALGRIPPVPIALRAPVAGGQHRTSLPPRRCSPGVAAMSAAAQAAEPDPQDGTPGHCPGPGPARDGSPQEEFDFSILFDYDYLKPIEGW